MHKPDCGIKVMPETMQHLRSGSDRGQRKKRVSMKREYWREWRAKAKVDLQKRVKEEDVEAGEEKQEKEE